MRHVGPDAKADEENPHMSMHRSDDGSIRCVIRAPMAKAWKYLFEQYSQPRRVV